MKIRSFILFFLDTILVVAIFIGVQLLKHDTGARHLRTYGNSFFLFLGIWVVVSLAMRKYSRPSNRKDIYKPISRIVISSAVVLGVITTLMYIFRIAYYSRFVVIGTISSVTALEMLTCVLFFWITNATRAEPDNWDPSKNKTRKQKFPLINKDDKVLVGKTNLLTEKAQEDRKNAILSEISEKAYQFIFKNVPVDSIDTFISNSTSHVNIQLLPLENVKIIVNLQRINNIRYLNKYFEAVNLKLPNGGIFIDYLETKNQRKKRIIRKFPPGLNYIYYIFDFILKRIFPKSFITKKIYFFLTRGQNRVLTKAEAFGRLYSCGFEVIDENESDGFLFFIAVKKKDPSYPERPTYGPLIQLYRVGKHGKLIKVYKLRTMHPYSEFLQEYVFQKEGLQEGGKFKSDFRVSKIGKFFRTFWLDELPMIINLIRGELKIVGVRPLSRHYFELYPKNHQERRIQYKPGLVPPFYVDNPKTLNEIIASETKYLDAYDKNGFLTDVRYFFTAFFNIFFKKYRSS